MPPVALAIRAFVFIQLWTEGGAHARDGPGQDDQPAGDASFFLDEAVALAEGNDFGKILRRGAVSAGEVVPAEVGTLP